MHLNSNQNINDTISLIFVVKPGESQLLLLVSLGAASWLLDTKALLFLNVLMRIKH